MKPCTLTSLEFETGRVQPAVLRRVQGIADPGRRAGPDAEAATQSMDDVPAADAAYAQAPAKGAA